MNDMAETSTPSNRYFVLLVDQEREFLLNLMAQHATGQKFAHDVEEFELGDAFESLKKDMIAGLKKVPWCNHRDCRTDEVADCDHKHI